MDPEAAGNLFMDLLLVSCSGIRDPWFLLPVDRQPSAHAYRERVYTYELYHQLRVRTEGTAVAGSPAYILSGEIDKAGLNAVIENGTHKPDLVWHVPSERLNAAVVEVKAAERWDRSGISKDLRTLAAFLSAGDRAYQRGALLMYGPGEEQFIADRVRALVQPVDEAALRRAHLLWHPSAGECARDLGPIG